MSCCSLSRAVAICSLMFPLVTLTGRGLHVNTPQQASSARTHSSELQVALGVWAPGRRSRMWQINATACKLYGVVGRPSNLCGCLGDWTWYAFWEKVNIAVLPVLDKELWCFLGLSPPLKSPASIWSSPSIRVVLLSNQRSLCLTEAAPDPGDRPLDVDSCLAGKWRASSHAVWTSMWISIGHEMDFYFYLEHVFSATPRPRLDAPLSHRTLHYLSQWIDGSSQEQSRCDLRCKTNKSMSSIIDYT